jgi:hypothetical protein
MSYIQVVLFSSATNVEIITGHFHGDSTFILTITFNLSDANLSFALTGKVSDQAVTFKDNKTKDQIFNKLNTYI